MLVLKSTYRQEKQRRETAERELAAERRLREQAEDREAAQRELVETLQAANLVQIATHKELQIDLLDRFEPKPVEVPLGEGGESGEITPFTTDQINHMRMIGKRGQRLRRQMLREAREREAKAAVGDKSEFATAANPLPGAEVDTTRGDGSILDEGERAILDALISGKMPNATEASN